MPRSRRGGEVTLDEALRAHTADATYALRMENRIGSLTPGRPADVVVLDHDLDRLGVDEPAGVDAWLTMPGGRVVHRS